MSEKGGGINFQTILDRRGILKISNLEDFLDRWPLTLLYKTLDDSMENRWTRINLGFIGKNSATR